jgi:peptidoglycan/LPS O-acetylase OafA/YrhL
MLFKRFQRKTNSTKFIPELDGLRFIAIFSVILFHTNSSFSKEWALEDYGTMALGGSKAIFELGWWFVRLDFGVKLFFVISGFILSVPFVKYLVQGKQVDITAYYKRRLIRLEPPYIFSLIFFALIHYFLLDTGIENIPLHFFSGLFYIHGLIFGYANPINPVAWSLEVEAQFYMLLPLCFLFSRKIKNTPFIITTSVLIFFFGVYLKNFISERYISNLYSSILYYIPNFLTGAFLGVLFVKKKSFYQRKSFIWDFIMFFSVLGIFTYYKPQSNIVNILVFNLSLPLFFLSAFKGHFLSYVLTRPIIYTIGGMCYSIYLLHFAILHLIALLLTPTIVQFTENYILGLVCYSLVAIPLSIIFSAIYFLIIEKPFMDPNIHEEFKNLRTNLTRVLKK